MNTDQAMKCTCISITIRCQPYGWHMSILRMKNMQENSKPKTDCTDLS